ncbi:F0F1 ATP synthase subunit gamma [Photobacterium rosenbergii]|uniref:ATP synthase gamma chain n=1 Tax=Photobacterium rosenbergii TaxID=294936 RepID=A0A2T3NHZ5_9GAMM|nr:F0F1 ATP synthase subunit gamma [Photobacterium rosenbergii]PSW14600.1 F0F1 ATP synthase subunit gamma [Photobacterium rosenbergii]
MANAKEIRTKIASVQSTQKITSAMEMVAASKIKKAQDNMGATRPYAETIRRVINHVASGRLEYHHPYLEQREIKRVGYIVIASDRGLCGGLNSNLFRQVLQDLQQWQTKGVEVEFTLIGAKAISLFHSIGNVVAQTSGLGDKPKLEALMGPVNAMLEQYENGKVDRVFLANNVFVNSMVQKPTISQLLPHPEMSSEVAQDNTKPSRWDYIYETPPKEMLNELMVRYLESQVYQGAVESTACEMAARQMAMKAATDNADDLINDLQLVHNKARQAAITQELSEIVAGAQAV